MYCLKCFLPPLRKDCIDVRPIIIVLVKTVYSYFVTLIINRGIEMSNDYSDLAIQAPPKQIQQEKDNFNQALLIFKNELANKSFTKLEMLPELVSLGGFK